MSASEKVKEVAERAKEATDRAADRGHEAAESARHKVHDAADLFREKTHDATEKVKEKTHGAGERTSGFLHRIPPRWRLVLALLIAVLAGYLLGHAGGKPSASQSSQAKPQAPPAPQGPPTVTLDPQQMQYAGLQIVPAQQVTLPTKLSTTGTVAANLNGQAAAMPRLPGKVVRVLANVGQTVRAGQTVAVISSPDLFNAQAAYRDAVLRRQAAAATLARQRGLAGLGQYGRPSLEQARTNFEQSQGEVQADKDAVNVVQAQVLQAQSQVNLTQKLYVRAQALYAHELIARQDLEQAQANAQQAQAALASTQSDLRQAVDRQLNAQKRGQVARRVLDREASVYRSGLLSAEQVGPAYSAYVQAAHEVEANAAQVRLLGGRPMDESDPGGALLDVTTPIAGTISGRGATLGQTVTPDMPLLTVLDLRTVVVQLTVYQEDLAHLRVGQPVAVTSNTAPDRTFSGRIAVIGAALDQATRTAQVGCLIQNPQTLLRPGVYVTGVVFGAARQNAVAVPFDAVQTLNGGSGRLHPDGQARRVRGHARQDRRDGGRHDADHRRPPARPVLRQQERLRPEVADGQGHAELRARLGSREKAPRPGQPPAAPILGSRRRRAATREKKGSHIGPPLHDSTL